MAYTGHARILRNSSPGWARGARALGRGSDHERRGRAVVAGGREADRDPRAVCGLLQGSSRPGRRRAPGERVGGVAGLRAPAGPPDGGGFVLFLALVCRRKRRGYGHRPGHCQHENLRVHFCSKRIRIPDALPAPRNADATTASTKSPVDTRPELFPAPQHISAVEVSPLERVTKCLKVVIGQLVLTIAQGFVCRLQLARIGSR